MSIAPEPTRVEATQQVLELATLRRRVAEGDVVERDEPAGEGVPCGDRVVVPMHARSAASDERVQACRDAHPAGMSAARERDGAA